MSERETGRVQGSRPVTNSMATTTSSNPSLQPLDDIAAHIGGTFVLVVQVTGGKYRRRCFLSVAAAQRAADRATDRGETATVYLSELRPLWKVKGGTP